MNFLKYREMRPQFCSNCEKLLHDFINFNINFFEKYYSPVLIGNKYYIFVEKNKHDPNIWPDCGDICLQKCCTVIGRLNHVELLLLPQIIKIYGSQCLIKRNILKFKKQ